MTFRSFALAALAAAAIPAQAAINIGTTTYNYTQSFDSLAASGSSNVWANDVTLAGWSLFGYAGTTIASYAADNGAGTSGGFKSYGSTGSTDRALGGLGSSGTVFGNPGPSSGSIAGYIAVAFTNLTGATITSFTTSFNGEEWRNGGNTSAQPMVLEYGYGSSFSSVSNWLSAGSSFNWSSPVATGAAAPLDGNIAGLVSGVGGTVLTNWASGQTLWIRWTERNDVGNDHGLAIDNFALSVTAVPEPGTLAMLLAGLATVGFVARRRT